MKKALVVDDDDFGGTLVLDEDACMLEEFIRTITPATKKETPPTSIIEEQRASKREKNGTTVKGVATQQQDLVKKATPAAREDSVTEERVLDEEQEETEEPELEGDVSAVPRLVNGQWKLGYDIESAYFREVSRHKLLTREEERELLARYLETKDGNAWDRLIACNQRLVMKYAKHYVRIYHIPFLDAVQEGNFGLMHAVRRYSFEKECKLSTYATWWIKQKIERWIMENNRTVRLPVHVHEILSKSRKASYRLLKSLGREPTKEEICEEIGISLKRLATAEEGLRKIFSTDVSISASDEDGDLLGDFLEDERPLPDEQLHDQELSNNVIRPALARIRPKARAAMVLRFGVEGVVFSEQEIVKAMSNQNRKIDLGMVREIEVSMLRQLDPPGHVVYNGQAGLDWLKGVSREGLTLLEDTIFILRYGIGARESSLEGVGERMEVTREYIRQMEEKTLPLLKKWLEKGIMSSERKAGIFIEFD